MGYTIHYNGLSEIEKHNKAIQDIKDYMGADRFDKLTEQFKLDDPEKELTCTQFEMIVSFAGVRGYPAKAWYNYIYGL